MKLSEGSIKKLEAAGIDHWIKGDMDRLYIDVKSLIDVDFYKSGNVRHAEINGEKISNSHATSLLYSKLYVDAKTGELVGSDTLAELAIEKYGLVEASEDTAEAPKSTTAKKVEFAKDGEDYQVAIDGQNYGKLTFDDDQSTWVLWPNQIDDGVTYTDDLDETMGDIKGEIEGYDDSDPVADKQDVATMGLLDAYLSKYSTSRYAVAKSGLISANALQNASEKGSAADISTKIIVAVAKTISKTPGTVLDELIDLED